MKQIYICPQNKELLKESKEGLIRTDGKLYPYLKGDKNILIPDFSTENEKSTEFINEYDSKESTVFYQNFLDWLFTTFNEKEYEFRIKVLKKLNLCKNYKVLITGCGLGADIQPIIDLFGSFGELYVCDLSAEMVIEASYKNQEIDNIFFSVCNAQNTPFKDDFFDGAFHFGGINHTHIILQKSQISL
jgi:ubiquinone/menaquinone biosynthesis C-methylase UbiE